MSTLDLYKDRKSHIVKLEFDGKPVDFKIPMYYTVEEVERLLEIQVNLDRIANMEASGNTKIAEKQMSDFYNVLFEQLLVLFNRYQPELTLEELKKILSQEEAVKIVAFHTKEQIAYATSNEGAPASGKKKALKIS